MSVDSRQVERPELTVACKKCGGHAGRIIDGALVYTVKHSGERHTVRIDLKYLEKLLHATKESVVS
jgi:hypothetical protein